MKVNSTIKELLKMDIDIDVYDDYDERLAIAFCGPIELTQEGLEKFGELLDTEIVIEGNDIFGCFTVIHCETGLEANKYKKLFDSMAGYCSESDFDSWFIL